MDMAVRHGRWSQERDTECIFVEALQRIGPMTIFRGERQQLEGTLDMK
jgi:hypothetical protein